VNGEGVKPSHVLSAGDLVEGTIPFPPAPNLVPEPIPLNIVYEDDHLLAVDKPPGLVVHPGSGQQGGTLANALSFMFKNSLSTLSGPLRPGIVHRIDKGTSGLVLVAKTNSVHQLLSELFKTRKVKKTYRAISWGDPGGQVIVEKGIGRSKNDRTKMRIDPDGRPSITRFSVKCTNGCFSELLIKPETGRTHQIRIHLSSIGHPIVGDPTYGGGARRFSQVAPLYRSIAGQILKIVERPMLHAEKLSFVHPVTSKRLQVKAEIPKDLKQVSKLLTTNV